MRRLYDEPSQAPEVFLECAGSAALLLKRLSDRNKAASSGVPSAAAVLVWKNAALNYLRFKSCRERTFDRVVAGCHIDVPEIESSVTR